jgi:hypothetical protein
VQPLAALHGPDFRSKQAQTHLHKAVIEMRQRHVVPAIGNHMIEGDRTNLFRVGMLQALGARRLGALERWQYEHRLSWIIGTRDESGLVGQLQGNLDDLQDVLR